MKENLWQIAESMGQPVRAPLQPIHDPLLDAHGVRLFLKREDLIHPHVSGNKWRKLKYNLLQARAEEQSTLLTFGGAYSNHILATAHAGRLWGFRTIGIIRGEAYAPLNPVLAAAQAAGMALRYMPRWRYRQKELPEVATELAQRFGPFYLLPEGGTNQLAVQGCKEIVDDIAIPFDTIVCPCGTGGTLAGLAAGLAAGQQALGVAVLRGENFLDDAVRRLLIRKDCRATWQLTFDYHLGGYAKSTPQLLEFIESFARRHDVRLDPVYTGKMMFGLYDLISKGRFRTGETVVAVHTGNGSSDM